MTMWPNTALEPTAMAVFRLVQGHRFAEPLLGGGSTFDR